MLVENSTICRGIKLDIQLVFATVKSRLKIRLQYYLILTYIKITVILKYFCQKTVFIRSSQIPYPKLYKN